MATTKCGPVVPHTRRFTGSARVKSSALTLRELMLVQVECEVNQVSRKVQFCAIKSKPDKRLWEKRQQLRAGCSLTCSGRLRIRPAKRWRNGDINKINRFSHKQQVAHSFHSIVRVAQTTEILHTAVLRKTLVSDMTSITPVFSGTHVVCDFFY